MSLRDCCSCNNINAYYTIKSLTSIIRQNTFYLPLCNHSLKTTSNSLSLNVLPWLQMPRFICNHLQPSATLSATLQPTEYQSVTRIFKQRLQMADENENYFSCLSNVQLELIAKQAIFTSKIIRSLTNHKLYVQYTDI